MKKLWKRFKCFIQGHVWEDDGSLIYSSVFEFFGQCKRFNRKYYVCKKCWKYTHEDHGL